MKTVFARLAVACLLLLGWGSLAARGMSWYEAAGALADGPAASGSGGKGTADSGNSGTGSGGGQSGSSSDERQHAEDVSRQEEAAKFRETMSAIVAEYDKIGAGELARQCIDASRIVQIAENPSGWKEILFLLAGLVSLIAALFITKILASMFKVEIAQLLWIPIAACILLLAGLFVAFRQAEKRKAAIAAGVVLSAAGVISFVDPVRHAFFGIVADVFVVFTAWYVPIAAVALGMAGLLFVFFLLCKNIGDGFGAIGAFLLRNTIGLVAIPGVCAVLFLAILSVVGPWFEGHAGDFASGWEGEAVQRQTGLGGVEVSFEKLRQLGIEAERESETQSSQYHGQSWESGSETHSWSGTGGGWRPGGGSAGQASGGNGGQTNLGISMQGRLGSVPFTSYPKEVRRTAAEIARAAEDVYDGRLPHGAEPFDAFLSNPALEAVSAHEWNRDGAVFSTRAGLVAQVYRRRTGWMGRETVVMFRGTANAKDLGEDWQQLFGNGEARQYGEAAALLRAVRETVDGPIVVAGHSLGGGQAQYALAMNVDLGEIRGVGFNPAGLSATTFASIEERLCGGTLETAGVFASVRLDNDPVSTVGIFLGRMIWVASNGVRGMPAVHSITTLAREMERTAA